MATILPVEYSILLVGSVIYLITLKRIFHHVGVFFRLIVDFFQFFYNFAAVFLKRNYTILLIAMKKMMNWMLAAILTICGFLPAGRRIQGGHILYDFCEGVKAVWQKGFKP